MNINYKNLFFTIEEYTNIAYTVYMEKNTIKQYTLRNIPKEVDLELKNKALETGKSFNQVAVEALINGCGHFFKVNRDLSDIVGTLSNEEASLLELEIKRQHQIDQTLWT